MKDFSKLADKSLVEGVIKNLESRGISGFYVKTKDEAKEKVLELLTPNSRVLASTSVTLEQTGIKDEIDDSGRYISVRKEYTAFDRETQSDKIRSSRSAPDVIVGSIQAVTKNGEVLLASNTGSQLAAYVSGAGKVIWVVGTQKIVQDLDEGLKRLNSYVVPLEEKHMQGLYGVGTNVSKLLIFNKEVIKDRVTLIFVDEVLGF